MTNADSLLGALGPILERVSPGEAPLLLASLERMAAPKYLGWADETDEPYERDGLLDCASRELAIADFLESLNPQSDEILANLQARFPDMQSLYDGVLAGQSRDEQLRRQAAGELGGADFLRQFRAAHSGAVAAQFEALALGEEANSKFLTVLLDSR